MQLGNLQKEKLSHNLKLIIKNQWLVVSAFMGVVLRNPHEWQLFLSAVVIAARPPPIPGGGAGPFTTSKRFTFSSTPAFVFCQSVPFESKGKHRDTLPGAKVKEFEAHYEPEPWASVGGRKNMSVWKHLDPFIAPDDPITLSAFVVFLSWKLLNLLLWHAEGGTV